jgi:hypothetical protein
MTSELIQSELEKTPFVPFRLHLGSGQKVDISTARSAATVETAVMLFHPLRHPDVEPGYDLISIYTIERLEQLEVPE